MEAGARFDPMVARRVDPFRFETEVDHRGNHRETRHAATYVNVSHAYSANRPARKFGPTGRPIRDLDALIQDNEAREALIDPRVLSWIAL